MFYNRTHLIDRYETRCQWQQENWEIHKCREIKQHTFRQPVGQRRNWKGNKKYLETNKNANTIYQNVCNAEKAVLKESIQQ